MGKQKWTREEIIRRILDLDAKGYPLTVGKPGVSPALYQAGSRIFGSWRNALQAAGLSPDRGSRAERWPPAKILMVIRNLSQRRRPLRKKELEERFGSYGFGRPTDFRIVVQGDPRLRRRSREAAAGRALDPGAGPRNAFDPRVEESARVRALDGAPIDRGGRPKVLRQLVGHIGGGGPRPRRGHGVGRVPQKPARLHPPSLAPGVHHRRDFPGLRKRSSRPSRRGSFSRNR